MSQKILITGAAGNVGREVINAFADRAQLRAAVFDMKHEKKIIGEDIECVYFNFEEPETYAPAFENVRAVFLMRPPQISNVKKYIAPAIDAAKAAGVEHIVFLSIVGVEKNKVVPHYKIEQHILQSGLHWTFLRASFFMQNLNTTHRTEIKEQHKISVPVGKGKTSFIDVRDIGVVAAKTLTEPEHRNKAYDLTGSEALDYFEVAEIFSRELGQKIEYTNPSIVRFFRDKLAEGSRLPFVTVMTGLYTLTRFGMSAQISPSVAQLLGRPPITLCQYVRDYRESWV